MSNNFQFCFSEVSVEEMYNKIKQITPKKKLHRLPVKVMKEDADIFSAYICGFVSKTVRSGKFPSILRHVKITPS